VFNWFANLFSKPPVTDGTHQWARRYRLLRARYDAAVTNEDNRRHWTAADMGPALEAEQEHIPDAWSGSVGR